jgi:hypothetical protein
MKNFDLAVIAGGMNIQLQPFDVSLNKLFEFYLGNLDPV